MKKPNVNDLTWVVWGEEQAAIPALVTEVSERGFKAMIMPPRTESRLGPFNFLFSDLDCNRGQ